MTLLQNVFCPVVYLLDSAFASANLFLLRYGVVILIFGLPFSFYAAHYIAHSLEKNALIQLEISKVYDLHYLEKCPAYRDASLYDKWFNSETRHLSWCDSYLGKL